jgi:hypothetical protein
VGVGSRTDRSAQLGGDTLSCRVLAEGRQRIA